MKNPVQRRGALVMKPPVERQSRLGLQSDGFSLPELLVAVVVLGLLAGFTIVSGQRWLAEQRLEAAVRLVLAGLDQGRESAERSGRPCALALTEAGWHAPSGGDYPSCLEHNLSLQEAVGGGEVQLQRQSSDILAFTSNGLVLIANMLEEDTIRLSTVGTPLVRCVAVSSPLGISRVGVWRESSCVPG